MSKKEKMILFPCLILVTVTIVLAACFGLFNKDDRITVEIQPSEYELHFPRTDEEYNAILLAEEEVEKEFDGLHVEFGFVNVARINEESIYVGGKIKVNRRAEYFYSVLVKTNGMIYIYRISEE